MKVALLGYGRFGRAFASLLEEARISVSAYDPGAAIPEEQRASDLADLVSGAEFIAVAVPVSKIADALSALRPFTSPNQIVFDVASVKMRPMELLRSAFFTEIPWVATHPLFGPVSLARAERPLRVVVCSAAEHPAATARVHEFYTRVGCEVIEQTAEAHDRAMAYTHALTFFVAKGMLDAGVVTDLAYAPPSFHGIARTIETVRSDAGHLFSAIQNENPFAAEARARLVDALRRINESLEHAPADAADATIQIPDLGARIPALRETREEIDSVDREIIELLRRRADLARRAGAAKASAGQPVIDPTREASLLAERRAWASEIGLDAETAEAIFREVVRGGRRVQAPR